MIRPVPMSFLTIFLNRDITIPFLEDLCTVKDFHLYNPQEKTDEGEKTPELAKSSIIGEDKKDKIEDQIDEIERYLRQIIEETDVDVENDESTKRDLITFRYTSIDKYFDDIQQKVEDLYYKVKRVRKKVEESDRNLEKIAEIASFLNLIYKFGGGDYSRKNFKKLNFELFVASESQYNQFRDASEKLNSPIVCYGEEIGPELIGFFVFYEKVYEEKISDLMVTYNCQRIRIPEKYVDETGFHMDKLKNDHDAQVGRRNKYAKIYQGLIENLHDQLLGISESLDNAIQLFVIMKGMQQTTSHNILKIEGYVPTRIAKNFVDAIKEQFATNIRVDVQDIPRWDPYEEEIEGEDEKVKNIKRNVPTLLKQNKMAASFQQLTQLYGTTNYSEINPSIILAFTFPLLFGFMFGDFGQGVCLLICGVVGWFIYRTSNPARRRLAIILAFCGIGAILGGIVYGESFGGDLIIAGEEIRLFVRPLDDITAVLKMAIIIGVIMICLGWLIKAINYVVNRRKFLAIADPIMKIIMMTGGTYLIFTYYFDIYAWLAPPEPILLVVIPSLIIVLIKPLGKALKVASYLKEESYGSLIGESLFDWVETMLQIISNVASFVRILALEMAHVGLMIVAEEVTNSIIPGSIVGKYVIAPLFLILYNAFVILLEMVIVMIHDLRLHFYEFFSKFYQSDGTEFKSVEVTNQYSQLDFMYDVEVNKCFNFQCFD